MKADPPVRRDGRCAQCSKPRKMPQSQGGVDPSVYALDPFCARTCAERWHAVTKPEPKLSLASASARRRYEKAAA